MNAAEASVEAVAEPGPLTGETYTLTRFVILRLLGFIYLIAFLAAARQLVPLVGSDGLTPGPLFVDQAAQMLGGTWAGFLRLPMVFWFDCSDTALTVVPWIGMALAFALVCGYGNALGMAVLWFLYMSVVHIGQDWYGYGWEIQLLETGFLAIFLCPLLDPRPFSRRPTPYATILCLRWLIVRVMLGSALIKWRGDSCWHDLTALYYFFETQPIPNPLSRFFHFLPHFLLRAGTIFTFLVEGCAPFLAFWPRWGRLIAGGMFVAFQLTLISCGNLSFFNWLTIVPALACFDDRALATILPRALVRRAEAAVREARPSLPMIVTAWVYAGVVVLLSIDPVMNLLSPDQAMNTSFDRLELVNTYGAFGTIGRTRDVLVFEGTEADDPAHAPDSAWKAYDVPYLPGSPDRAPAQIAPYQPHLDWQLWFAAMGSPTQYPWTLNLTWKLLHNDPVTLRLMAGNPFPDHPPRYIRVQHYIYHFAPPGNPQHVYWTRELVGPWLPPLSTDNRELRQILTQFGWLPAPPP
jgi:hypothetical protein